MPLVPVEAAKNSKSVAVARGPFEIKGFRVGAAACGMRYRDRPDLALIVADPAAAAAGVFTRNRFTAAPVVLCKDHLASPRIKAVLVNAGIANACTGAEGLHRARETARLLGGRLGVSERQVLVASTGIIGPQIAVEVVAEALPGLVGACRTDGWADVASAIMTTDTVPKQSWTRVELDGKPATIGGVAKGSGMIAPDMATLLVFVATDAAVAPRVLEHWLRLGADASFNSITIDGDTSTNDTLLVLAGGAAGNELIDDNESDTARLFGAALEVVLRDLARQVVEDGEGATKFIEITVAGAADVADARKVALTVANSALVKTAFFGEDANWGRIVAAVGRAGVLLDPDRVTLHFDSVCVFRDGTPVQDPGVEEAAAKVLKREQIPVRLDLGLGDAVATVCTTDFSYDYVKINADYRS